MGMIPAIIGSLIPAGPRRVAEAVKVRVVEEQLGDDQVRAVIHLALEVLKVSDAVEALRVALGVAGDANAEIVA
jgi:hypothetical protein